MDNNLKVVLEKPQPKQELFLLAKTRYVAFGGARGGGKSWAIRVKATMLGLNASYAGIRMLLLRKTYPELKENHILPLMKILKDVAVYKETDKAFTFMNGSRLKLGYLSNDADILQYQGQEYDVIFMDEATHFTEFMFKTLTASLRGANNFPKRFYLTCNPGGIGHNWVKRLFITRQYTPTEDPSEYTFIQSKVYDNQILMKSDPDYVKMLENLPDKQRKAWLEGDWDIFDGQYFSEWSCDAHTIEPFEIPDHWTVYTVMDYGLDMLAHYWIAVDEKNNAYVIKELHEKGLIVSEAVRRIKEIETETIYTRIAPPDLWNTQSATGKSTALLFDESGMRLQKANNDRIAGWLALRELLKVEERLQPDGTVVKSSRLKVFRNCTHLIECMPALQFSEKNPNDAASEPHDITHAPDALRYFAISWTYPSSSRQEEKKKKDWFWDNDEKEEGYITWE